MSDCPNVEMRELLPELLHGRLDVARAAQVREHIATCAECAVELELLGRARRVYASGTPVLDTAAIVRALPQPRGVRPARPRRTYSLGMVQLAAAIVLLLAGAFVMRTVLSGRDAGGSDEGQLVVQPADTIVDSASRSTAPAVRPTPSAEPRVLAMSLSELDGLEADEIETMLAALDRIDAAPAAEPDTLIGSVRGLGSSEG